MPGTNGKDYLMQLERIYEFFGKLPILGNDKFRTMDK